MSNSPRDPRIDNLPAAQAARLLERASELDAARRNELTVAELRAAALEAGISAEAFEATLAEMQTAPAQARPVDDRPQRRGRWTLSLAAIGIVLVGLVGVSRERADVAAAEPALAGMVEESIILQCLTPGEAAVLLRPVLRDGASTVTASRTAPRVLTIRARPAGLEQAKQVLAEHERSGTTACGASTDTRSR